MLRYAIYGAGSLGTILGAFITQKGVPIDLINRNQAHVDALNEKGARITGTVDMTVPVRAITPDMMEGRYDVILLMTKQLQNQEVVTHLRDYLSEGGVIVTLQNGLSILWDALSNGVPPLQPPVSALLQASPTAFPSIWVASREYLKLSSIW